MKYRAEIDGLRALAVIPVILFHAGFELFSGGFVGVDVFYVISGYLITTILIEDIEDRRFSIARFYERRARRILPALFFIILCCIPFAWMWMLPGQLKDFSQSLVAVSLFVSNVLFWRESGNIHRVYPVEIFCNTSLQGRCDTSRNGLPLYIDDDHLANSTGAVLLAQRIAGEVSKIMGTQPGRLSGIPTEQYEDQDAADKL